MLNRGAVLADSHEISRDELIKLMTSGAELDALTHELERILGIPTAYSGLEPAGVVASRVPRPRYASCCTSSASNGLSSRTGRSDASSRSADCHGDLSTSRRREDAFSIPRPNSATVLARLRKRPG